MSPIATITNFASANPHLAYGAVFLLALSEAVPVVGAVLPGSALIIGISALAPQGIVSIWPLLVSAILGAVVGDGLSYWLGHRYHEQILCRWPLSRYSGVVKYSEAFFRRHGAKSVFLARFTPGVRAFVPLIAGVLRMPAGRFYAANLLSALAWAPAHILPGLLIGASLSAAGPLAGRAAVLLALIVVFLWLVLWAARYALRRGVPLLLAAQERLWLWAQARDNWLGRRVAALVDSSRPEVGTLALFASVTLGATWLFFGVLEDVVSGDPLVQADTAVYNFLQSLRTPAADAVMIAITELGDTVVVTAVAAAVFFWLASRRAWRTTLYWAAAVGLASLMNTGIKLLVHRARPNEILYFGWSAFSFPSGHSTVNAALYGFLGFLIARELRPAWRLPVLATAFSFAALIAFSRLYLGAHWFSDVVGSLAFATAWLVVLGLAYVQHGAPRINARALSIVACAAVVLAGGFNIYRHHAADTGRYAVREAPTPVITASDWLTGGWRELPAYRTDLTGEAEEPLTVQWAGDLRDLQAELLRKGWLRPVPWTLGSALAWLAPVSHAMALPVVPLAEAGRLPSLTMVHASLPGVGPEARLVLRLWAADLRVQDEGPPVPLWIGSVVEERLQHPLSLCTIASVQPDMDQPRQAVAAAVEARRLASRGFASPGWDGRVLLISNSVR